MAACILQAAFFLLFKKDSICLLPSGRLEGTFYLNESVSSLISICGAIRS